MSPMRENHVVVHQVSIREIVQTKNDASIASEYDVLRTATGKFDTIARDRLLPAGGLRVVRIGFEALYGRCFCRIRTSNWR
jgi:hypothetical protein